MAPRRKTARRPPVSAPSKQPESSFPSGTYGKYKRATEYFLHWLLRARDGGVLGVDDANKPTNAQRKTLELCERIVGAIATQPALLSPALLGMLLRALEACETAITLRARVALFFAESADDEDDSHAHFLGRLQSWFHSLKKVYTPTVGSSGHKEEKKRDEQDSRGEKPFDFSNYYDVLALPDDYFDDDQLPEPLAIANANKIKPLSSAERRRLFDEAFDEDVKIELACFFMELEELVEAVYAAFFDVKVQKKTLLEATCVAKIAIDCANGVIARLQLRYPLIEDGIDLMVMMSEFFPFQAVKSVRDDVLAAWTPSIMKNAEPKYQYVRGTILWDVLWSARGLLNFANSITPGSRIP